MIEGWLHELTRHVVPVIELMALILIAAGTVEAFFNGIRLMVGRPGSPHESRAAWMRYSRWLVTGLTFQLAADIIETSAAPTWDDIGRLAAIAVIRTFLNYFLERDQRELREIEREEAAARLDAEPEGRVPAAATGPDRRPC